MRKTSRPLTPFYPAHVPRHLKKVSKQTTLAEARPGSEPALAESFKYPAQLPEHSSHDAGHWPHSTIPVLQVKALLPRG